MKYLKFFLFLIAVSLLSCHKEVAEPAEDGPVIAMLEIKSNVRIPKDVTMIRLTELLHDSTTVLIPAADRPDTTKAILSLSYRSIPKKKFNALISVYYKNGKIVNNEINDVHLEKGMKSTYIGNIFTTGFSIGYNDEWSADSVIIEF